MAASHEPSNIRELRPGMRVVRTPFDSALTLTPEESVARVERLQRELLAAAGEHVQHTLGALERFADHVEREGRRPFIHAGVAYELTQTARLIRQRVVAIDALIARARERAS